MALTHRQVCNHTGVFGASQDISFPGSIVATPNFLGFLSTFAAKAGSNSSCSDDSNGSYSREIVSSGPRAAGFMKLNGSGVGLSPTLTIAPDTSDWFGCVGVEFSGSATELEDIDTDTASSDSPIAGTVEVVGAAIVYGFISYYNATRPTPITGWTEVAFSTDLGFQPYSLIYRTVTAGSWTPEWTAGGSIAYEAVAVAIKEGSLGNPWYAYRQQQ
jgi:hypothetical protein